MANGYISNCLMFYVPLLPTLQAPSRTVWPISAWQHPKMQPQEHRGRKQHGPIYIKWWTQIKKIIQQISYRWGKLFLSFKSGLANISKLGALIWHVRETQKPKYIVWKQKITVQQIWSHFKRGIDRYCSQLKM